VVGKERAAEVFPPELPWPWERKRSSSIWKTKGKWLLVDSNAQDLNRVAVVGRGLGLARTLSTAVCSARGGARKLVVIDSRNGKVLQSFAIPVSGRG